MNRRLLVLASFSLLACSRSSQDAGIVLDVDADPGVTKTSIDHLLVSVDGKEQTWALTQALPGSLGIVTSPGPKVVTVDGLSGAAVLGHWSGQIVASKGAVVHQNVLLTSLARETDDAGVPDSKPDFPVGTGGMVGTGGVAGTGGVVGTGGAVGTGGVIGTAGAVGTAGGAAGTAGSGGRTGLGGASGTGGIGGLPTSGGTTNRGGTSASTGSSSGGSPGSGAATGTGGRGGVSDAGLDAGNQPCVPVKEFPRNALSDNVTLGTVDEFCFRVQDDILGWMCSNFRERTLKVNGVSIECGASLPPKTADGWYYFDCSAGGVDYASVMWWHLNH